VIARALGVNPSAYEKETYDVLSRFLQYLRDNKRSDLTEPGFLSSTLMMFMRGAYLREPLDENTRTLDLAVRGFFEKSSGDVSLVFQGKIPELSAKINDATFRVGRGYILVEHPAGLLITRYMPAEQ